jgi:hypothetical protein
MVATDWTAGRRVLRSGLLALVATALLGGTAAARRKVDNPAAEALQRGRELFKQRDYRSAAEAFEESYRSWPHFETLCELARCQERLNDLVKAVETYGRCLEEGAGQTKRARRLHEARTALEARITTVAVTSPGAGGIVHVDGAPRGAAPQEVRLSPGQHVVEVRRNGARAARDTVDARGGTRTLELVPTPLAPTSEPEPAAVVDTTTRPSGRPALSPTWFWIGAGLTAALAVTASVFGALTLKANQDYEDNPTWDGHDKVLDYRLATNILFGAAACAAGASTVMFVYTDFRGGRAESDGREATLHIGVGVRGRF